MYAKSMSRKAYISKLSGLYSILDNCIEVTEGENQAFARGELVYRPLIRATQSVGKDLDA